MADASSTPKFLATLRRRSSNRISFLSILEFLEKLWVFLVFPKIIIKNQKNQNFSYLSHVKNFSGFSKNFFLVFMGFRPAPIRTDLPRSAFRSGVQVKNERKRMTNSAEDRAVFCELDAKRLTLLSFKRWLFERHRKI